MSVGILVLAPVANAPLFLLSFETVKLSIHCNELPTMKIDGIVLVDNAWESPIFAEFCTWFAEQTVVPPLYRWTSSNEGSLLTCVSSKRRVRIAQDYYSNLCQSNTVSEWSSTTLVSLQAAKTNAQQLPLLKRLLKNWRQVEQLTTAQAVWNKYKDQVFSLAQDTKKLDTKQQQDKDECQMLVDPDFLIQWLSNPNIATHPGWMRKSREQQLALLNEAFQLIAMSGQKYIVKLKDKIPYNIICLERRMGRNRAKMESQLEQFSSWLQPNFIPAVDGLDLKRDPKRLILPQLWNEDPKKRLNFGQTGCSLSHFGTWQDKPYKGWEIEGEDDFFVGPTFGRDMPALVTFVTLFAGALDSMGIDVIMTGFHIAKQFDRWAMLVNIGPKSLIPLPQNGLATIGGAFGYFVSEKGRKRFREGFLKIPADQTVRKNMDVWMLEQEPHRQLTLNVPIILSEYYNNTAFRSDLTY